MKTLFYILFSILLCVFETHAQDSLRTLNAEEVLNLVRKYHPVARQTNIEIEKTQAEILMARAAFDPILSHYVAQKTFGGTQYYNTSSPEIRIPTWYGIEVSAGLENLNGGRIDPSETLGQTSFVGISIPLAKNLVIDKRRAFLQQAKIYRTMAAVEQRAALNDLLLGAMEAYWQWVQAYQTYKVLSNNVLVNEQRVVLVKKSYFNGERPAIDTLEATAQLQSFQYLQNQEWLNFQNAGLQLSAYLWKSNQEPYYLPESVVPQQGWENETNINQFNLILGNLLETADRTHPDLQLYTYKLDALAIDKKLKFQELLPKIDLKYNQLGKGYNLWNTLGAGPLFENNYQYGLKFEMPLRLSQGRSAYKQAKLKIESTQLDQNQKRLAVGLKVKNYYNDFVNLRKQITLQSGNYDNYRKLVVAEETRFQNGESSLFLINSRENKALEALEKLIELKTKYFKTLYALQWSAGLLGG